MMPGVTYLPVPSITTASAGALIDVPTDTIFPSRNRIDAFCIVGPAAVIIVALRISVVCDGNGTYVLGNGLAFGSDRAPFPGRPAESVDEGDALATAGVLPEDGETAVDGAGL